MNLMIRLYIAFESSGGQFYVWTSLGPSLISVYTLFVHKHNKQLYVLLLFM